MQSVNRLISQVLAVGIRFVVKGSRLQAKIPLVLEYIVRIHAEGRSVLQTFVVNVNKIIISLENILTGGADGCIDSVLSCLKRIRNRKGPASTALTTCSLGFLAFLSVLQCVRY